MNCWKYGYGWIGRGSTCLQSVPWCHKSMGETWCRKYWMVHRPRQDDGSTACRFQDHCCGNKVTFMHLFDVYGSTKKRDRRCRRGDGDCDKNSDCQPGLICGDLEELVCREEDQTGSF